ncbi:hypothetical protein CWC25_22575, partial [Pseudoalteromonas sp. S4389]|uniref:hypothetical protein n=1 Tax=Pseudoalteromonas sp. S4389 TaxID=579556 RepID=UPI00126D9B65
RTSITFITAKDLTPRFWQYHDEPYSPSTSNEINHADHKLEFADTLNEAPNTVLLYRAELAKPAGQYQNAMHVDTQVRHDEPVHQPTFIAML